MLHVGQSPDFRVSKMGLLSRYGWMLQGAHAWFLATAPFAVCCCMGPLTRQLARLPVSVPRGETGVQTCLHCGHSTVEAGLSHLRESTRGFSCLDKGTVNRMMPPQDSFLGSSHRFTIGTHDYRGCEQLRSWAE